MDRLLARCLGAVAIALAVATPARATAGTATSTSGSVTTSPAPQGDLPEALQTSLQQALDQTKMAEQKANERKRSKT